MTVKASVLTIFPSESYFSNMLSWLPLVTMVVCTTLLKLFDPLSLCALSFV